MPLRLRSTWNPLCAGVLLCLALFCTRAAAQVVNVTPNKSNAVAFLPWNFETADPIPRFEQTMSTERGQSYPRFIMPRTDAAAIQQTWRIEHLVGVAGQTAWLWLVSHGNPTKISLENYPITPAGTAEWNARIATLQTTYTLSLDTSQPGFQLYAWTVLGRHVIAMGLAFVPIIPTPDVVYLAACCSQQFAPAFVGNGAMCAIYYDYKVYPAAASAHATTIFERMNGEQGVGTRPLAAAVGGLALSTAGATNHNSGPCRRKLVIAAVRKGWQYIFLRARHGLLHIEREDHSGVLWLCLWA